jgi:hypothetical protein
MAYNSTVSLQIRAAVTNELQEVTIPTYPVAAESVFYLHYTLTTLAEQNILAGITVPNTGLPLKYLFIKADAPVELSAGSAVSPTYTGRTSLYHLEVYPTTGQLVNHAYIKAGLTGANVTVLMAFD